MNNQTEFDDLESELLNLADDCLNNTISDEQLARLDVLVSHSPTARHIYWRAIQDGRILKLWAQSAGYVEQPGGFRSPQTVVPVDCGRAATGPAPGTARGGPTLGFLAGSLDWVPRCHVSPRTLVIVIAATLSVYFVGLVAMLCVERAWMARPAVHGPPADGAGRLAVPRDAAPTRTIVAHLGETTGCVWDAGPIRSTVVSGQALKLLGGVAQFRYDTGVVVVVEGPCYFAFETSERLLLSRGKLLARVPGGAHGFTVVAPTAEIIDLGTEFGVEVAPAGETHVLVREGRVNISRPADTDGRAPLAVTLQAGQAARIDTRGGFERTPPDQARFNRTLSDAIGRSDPTGDPIVPDARFVEMFADNFRVVLPTESIDPSENDRPARQTGLLAPLSYAERPGIAASCTRLGQPRFADALLMVGGDSLARTTVSPLADFRRESTGPVRYCVECLVNPARLLTDQPVRAEYWISLIVGANDHTSDVVEPFGGLGIVVRGNGGYRLFDSTGGESQSMPEGHIDKELGLDTTGWLLLRIDYLVKAFDGKSPCEATISIDGRRLLSYETQSGFTHNQIIIGSIGDVQTAHAVKNLRIGFYDHDDKTK